MVVPAPWWEQTGIFCSCSNLKAIRNSDFKETPVYCTDPNQQLSRKGSASLTSSLLILVSALPVTCLRGGRKLTRALYSGKKASLLLQEAPQEWAGVPCRNCRTELCICSDFKWQPGGFEVGWWEICQAAGSRSWFEQEASVKRDNSFS